MALIKNMLTIAGVGLVVAVATFMLDVYQVYDERNQKVSGRYTEIIVDASLNMREKFPGVNKTKWDSVSSTVQNVLQNQHKTDNISIRVFGGDCRKNDTNTKLLTEFGKSNFSEMIYELSKVQPRGKASLKSAIINATADFSELEHLNTVTRRLILVIGSNKFCIDQPSFLAKQLKQRLGEAYKIEAIVIGYKLKQSSKKYLSRFKGIVFDDLIYADSEGQLFQELEKAVAIDNSSEELNNKKEIDLSAKKYSSTNVDSLVDKVSDQDKISVYESHPENRYLAALKEDMKFKKSCAVSYKSESGSVISVLNYVNANTAVLDFSDNGCFLIHSMNQQSLEFALLPALLSIDEGKLTFNGSKSKPSKHEYYYFGKGTYKNTLRVDIVAIAVTNGKRFSSVNDLNYAHLTIENHSVKTTVKIKQ
jgi:hypothetical protein